MLRNALEAVAGVSEIPPYVAQRGKEASSFSTTRVLLCLTTLYVLDNHPFQTPVEQTVNEICDMGVDLYHIAPQKLLWRHKASRCIKLTFTGYLGII